MVPCGGRDLQNRYLIRQSSKAHISHEVVRPCRPSRRENRRTLMVSPRTTEYGLLRIGSSPMTAWDGRYQCSIAKEAAGSTVPRKEGRVWSTCNSDTMKDSYLLCHEQCKCVSEKRETKSDWRRCPIIGPSRLIRQPDGLISERDGRFGGSSIFLRCRFDRVCPRRQIWTRRRMGQRSFCY